MRKIHKNDLEVMISDVFWKDFIIPMGGQKEITVAVENTSTEYKRQFVNWLGSSRDDLTKLREIFQAILNALCDKQRLKKGKYLITGE